MSDKPETARECAERLVGVRWTPKSGWPTEVEFLTGTLVDSITSALEERERERVSDEDIGEFQDQVRDLVIKLSGAPEDLIDGKGSDSGWEEFTLAEIGQGFAFIREERDTLKVQLAEAVELMRDFELYKTDDHNARRAFIARVKGSEAKEGAS